MKPRPLAVVAVGLLLLVKLSAAATHWVVTEDGKIAVQDDSVFHLRRPHDLVALLHQEQRASQLSVIKSRLIAQKHEIESNDGSAGSGGGAGQGHSGADQDADDVEQMIYQSNDNCHRAGKPLTQFDLYVGTQFFFIPTGDGRRDGASADDVIGDRNNNYVKIVAIESRPEKKQPNCSKMMALDFSMSSFEHLPAVRERHQLEIDPEDEIHTTITNLKDVNDYGDAVFEALQQNTSSWLLYTMASYYWRAVGGAGQSVECLRRALHLCPHQHRHIPLVSLANVLHRAKRSEDAAIVLHAAIDVAPDTVIAHYTLGNVYAAMADYNKSIICFDNVLRLDPTFEEAVVRKHAVLCHFNVEKALKAQHDTLQKTLEELQGYQKQQELWLHHQQKILAEQALPSVLLEQRLHYREFKIREIIESTNRKSTSTSSSSTSSTSSSTTSSNPTGDGDAAEASSVGDDQPNASASSAEAASSPSDQFTCQSMTGNASPNSDQRSSEDGGGGGDGSVANGAGAAGNECQMVPILVPITFVPPSG